MGMSVAKSYEKYEILRGPYEKDKRFYVEVEYKCCSKKTCQKCGGKGFYPKEVRWYNDKIVCDVKGAFGFRNEKEQWKKNPIAKAKNTIFKNLDDPQIARWYLERKCKDEFSTKQEVELNSIELVKQGLNKISEYFTDNKK